MKSTDLIPGEVITDGNREYIVIDLDHANDTITAKRTGYKEVTWSSQRWTGLGYIQKSIAQQPTGLAQPAPPRTSVVFPYYSFKPDWSGLFKTNKELEQAAKEKTREVSHNGKDWVRYELLLDADDFESYEHRRMV